MPGQKSRFSSSRWGFTLVELLVVIGIIALLISVLLPALSKAKEQANQVKCAANLHQLGLAMMNYCNDYKGIWVPGQYVVDPTGTGTGTYASQDNWASILISGKYIPKQNLGASPPQIGITLPPSVLACPTGAVYTNTRSSSPLLGSGAYVATTYGCNTLSALSVPLTDISDYNWLPMKSVYVPTPTGTSVPGGFRRMTDFRTHPADLVLLYDGNYENAVDGPYYSGLNPTYEFRHGGTEPPISAFTTAAIAAAPVPKGKCNVLLSDLHVEPFFAKQLPHSTPTNPGGSFYTANNPTTGAITFGRPYWYCNERQ